MKTTQVHFFDRPIHPALPFLRNEVLLFAILLALAIVTRFYDLGTRVMSHDESLHTYFSWLLYRGQGYQHSPMMHGPFQFHIVALMYLLFGASDFTSRIPAALFSVASIAMLWAWRRYIGRTGALLAALMLLISPYMLFYGRYVRNESFAAFSGIAMLYIMLRHLEGGERRWLYAFAATLALHFVSKETAFIYVAQALLYLAIHFVVRITRKPWPGSEHLFRAFVVSLSLAVLLFGAAVGTGLLTPKTEMLSAVETVAPADPSSTATALPPAPLPSATVPAYLLGFALLFVGASIFFLVSGLGWAEIRAERSFDLLMLAGMLVLPMLSPLGIKATERWIGIAIPTTAAEFQALASNANALWTLGAFLLATFLLSAVAGLVWSRSHWWKLALAFWIPFTVLYTTVFTNSVGFFTGAVGSLGYWLVQQGVERGSQPWYYYALIQLPLYEFLPAAGFGLALILGLRRSLVRSRAASEAPLESNFSTTFTLLAWWGLSALMAFSLAGEKMPWLTVHITWPFILLAGWVLGHLIEATDWRPLLRNKAAMFLGLILAIVVGGTNAVFAAFGDTPPFQGQELEQLRATAAFLLPAIVASASAVGLLAVLRTAPAVPLGRPLVLVVFVVLGLLTARSSFRATYINYDRPTEFLVYAHSARGVKDILEQADEISERSSAGKGAVIAYDASAPDTGVSWPFVWYLRDFTSLRSFDQPTRSLREAAVVIVDQKNFDKIEAALGPGFYRTDYIRMWWPMQDYFGVPANRDPELPFPEDYPCRGLLGALKVMPGKDFSRFCNIFVDPQVRAGVLQIWLNRDYAGYAAATGRNDLTLATWQPADQMRLYIRRDVASEIWNYGVAPAAAEDVQDPTEGKFIVLPADRILGASSSPNPVALNGPRAMAFAPDGTLYVADTRNHRVLHLNADGLLLHQWGTFADGISAPAAPGTFNEPWGIGIGPDGSVFVSDTWNNRIQKFTRAGDFIRSWGGTGQGEATDSFYGPRGLAVDDEGQVYVADTGNKRIVVFDANGGYISQFGSAGFDPGQFDEPVGIAVDTEHRLYVTDTWNQRVQTFLPTDDVYLPERQWDVYGWFGQSVDNKPFVAVNGDGQVFITDPEGYRVMQFAADGQLIRVWGEYGSSDATFGLPSGIAADTQGHIWTADAGNNRLLRFTLP